MGLLIRLTQKTSYDPKLIIELCIVTDWFQSS